MGNAMDTRAEAAGGESMEGIGTRRAGYAPPSDGPFRCDGCEHYGKVNGTHGDCDHPEVAKDLGTPARVAAGGCCNYFRPEEGGEEEGEG